MRRKVQTYGEVVARLLEESGLSAYRLARLAGLDAPTISNIATNKRKPTAETLERLLRAAGKSWVWLDANLASIELPSNDDT